MRFKLLILLILVLVTCTFGSTIGNKGITVIRSNPYLVCELYDNTVVVNEKVEITCKAINFVNGNIYDPDQVDYKVEISPETSVDIQHGTEKTTFSFSPSKDTKIRIQATMDACVNPDAQCNQTYNIDVYEPYTTFLTFRFLVLIFILVIIVLFYRFFGKKKFDLQSWWEEWKGKR